MGCIDMTFQVRMPSKTIDGARCCRMASVIKMIRPALRVKARIQLPGSKSITHRALLMAALSQGKSLIKNPLVAEDTLLTANALRQLGVEINWKDDNVWVIPPLKRWNSPPEPIWLGNSGTSMRLLIALAAAGTGRFVFDGTARLRERPIGPIVDALKEVGVRFNYLGESGYPPVEVVGNGLVSGDLRVDASKSSQFLSGLLIACPCADGEMRVGWGEPVASFPYVRITLDMMEQLGIAYQWLRSNGLVVPAPQTYAPFEYNVEGDCSSASYFWGAAALTGGEVFTYPLSPTFLQGDCRLLGVLEEMGCRMTWDDDGVRVRGTGELKPVDLDMNAMPDMVPTIAVVAAFACGRSRIRNVAHLRIKESDRLSVVTSGLRALGVSVEELPDGLVIDGDGAMHGGAVECHDDHRIAMAFAMAGLRVEGVEIHGAECVGKSFPSFWETFELLYREK